MEINEETISKRIELYKKEQSMVMEAKRLVNEMKDNWTPCTGGGEIWKTAVVLHNLLVNHNKQIQKKIVELDGLISNLRVK